MINFKFKSVIAFPSTSSGNGQNSLPVQLKFGNLLLDPPRQRNYKFQIRNNLKKFVMKFKKEHRMQTRFIVISQLSEDELKEGNLK